MPSPEKPPSPDADQPVIDEARMRRALGLDRPPAAPSTQSAQQRPAQQRPAQQRPEQMHPVQMRPEQARARHRFVQDGEVPVVVVNGHGASEAATPNEQAAGVQAKLRAEQQARADAERSLAEARATMRSLQAKLAHAELAHAEALAAERRAREAAETALRDATAARGAAEQRPRETAPVPATDAPTAEPTPKRTRAAKPARKAGVKPAREPKPVKWWLPSYKARKG